MSNGDHNIKDDGGESHHPEEAFLSGPLREMQAGSRQNTLAYGYPPPETTFQTTLGGLRTRLHDLRTVEKPMDGMESTMHDLFSAIRADKMELYAQENASVADDNASSVAVEDHASDKSPSETDSATAQHDADMQEIDAAELRGPALWLPCANWTTCVAAPTSGRNSRVSFASCDARHVQLTSYVVAIS
ncbi:hypothetical protein R3P38DRAFT_3173787 [Favolaschia claudopus]|uniref:Uncharacterized protein n=1 Tax=Favolaschia claudopus TaxID=2862362 RepID=A0AAW0DCK3_9AGAR